MGEFALTGDIEKMFRQIWIKKQDRDLQRIVWRPPGESKVKHFQLNTVTYGTRSAPYLAIWSIIHIGNLERDNFTLGSKAVTENFYVDDLLFSHHEKNIVHQTKRELTEMLRKYGMKIRKWNSNNKELVEDVVDVQGDIKNLHIDKETLQTKTLGLCWNTATDQFMFQYEETERKGDTKRAMLSELSRVFDPLGLISPCVVRLKALFQSTWLQKTGWDDKLPYEIIEKWVNYRQDLQYIKEIKEKRWVNTTDKEVEIHGFCDASESSYGAIVYVVTKNGNIQESRMIMSKTKVTPLKRITLPRLELIGATLLVKVLKIVRDKMNLKIKRMYAWCDSTITLAWIKSPPQRWNTFVANGVSSIQRELPEVQWGHVKSKQNPADICSRGSSAIQLKENQLWWSGPTWLKDLEHKNESVVEINTTEEQQKNAIILKIETYNHEIFDRISKRCSTFSKMVRLVKVLLKTRDMLRNIQTIGIEYQEWISEQAIRIVLIHAQQKANITKDIMPNWNCFSDNRIIRIGGRLGRAKELEENVRHPIILPKEGKITAALIWETHIETKHGGPRLIRGLLAGYHIQGGLAGIRKHIKNCVPCNRYKKSFTPIMSDLPVNQVVSTGVFQDVGVDFCGPFLRIIQ